ncbi:hypothetical protein NC796_03160 [Aliifodinibius sp. S!AR15-10]|uniref:hypothetical protein n=1 Tax=Aliifodinibius sp. S!AR15-10 TaxID=2950437 RepID=UPI0028596A26|nr:hypothetical protein [Aliifodinibius sp. S!AR15-10]MDR8390124.1 hypothetical protein [Aliifodinibius sp. S!AR15-10]
MKKSLLFEFCVFLQNEFNDFSGVERTQRQFTPPVNFLVRFFFIEKMNWWKETVGKSIRK